MLKTDTKVDEREANQDAREVTNVLGEANNDLMQYQNQEDNEGLKVLNQSGQSDHHRSYTQFGSVDKARGKANQDVVNSKEGINQSTKP
jgi:imidazoleglycerol phosphate dehydratase HisB